MVFIKKVGDKILLVILIAGLLIHSLNIIADKFSLPFLVVVAILGALPVLFAALASLKNKKISVDFLAAIALVASMFLGEWSSAIFINLMLVSARILDSYSEGKMHFAINSLLKLRPTKVRVKIGEDIIEKDAGDVKKDELVIIESGERIPVDGVIVNGEVSIDQSSLTGESVPVFKRTGENVLSSTLVVSGSLIVRAEKIGKDTMFERVINLVEGAHQAKPGINTIADRFASWYVIITLIGSVVFYLISRNAILLLSVLLVACADDIAVAIPMAFLISIGNAAKRGIIVKGGNFLEVLTKVKKLIVDKTGTLTLGQLSVERVVALGSYQEDAVLKLAAVAEFFSNHASAKAVVGYAEQKRITFQKPEIFNEFPGKGSVAVYEGKQVVTGKAELLKEKGVIISEEQTKEIAVAESKGLNVTLVAYGGILVGYVALADQIRPGVVETISKLKKMGIKNCVMLTGDNEEVAQKIAKETGITEFHANLLPENKLEFIKKHLGTKSKLAMVGDGVNDAAALALADVGIAMGAIGSDAAIEAADIALMKDDFTKIPEIIEIGNKTMHISYQNFWIWGIVNVFGFILVFAGLIGPQGAAAYNFITDFFPLMNSARLFRYNNVK